MDTEKTVPVYEENDDKDDNVQKITLSASEPEAEGKEIQKFTQLSKYIFLNCNKKISNHGNVFEGELRSGVYGVRVCAIKFGPKSKRNENEARILTKLSSHTNVVSIIESGIHEDGIEEHLYIALDKCHGENLSQHLLQRNKTGVEFNLTESLEYSKQIIAGVTYVHENLIIHRDLKPPNILFSNDKRTIKIADFDVSQEIKSASSKVYSRLGFGTNGFRPPESFRPDWASLRSDIFSLGVVFYFLLSNGKSPFGEEISLQVYKMQNAEINFSGLLVPNAKKFQHLLALMLSKDRCRRPSIWQVANHPCWTGKDVECDFDYGLAEEIADDDIIIPDNIRQDSNDSETEMESLRQFLKAAQKIVKIPSTNPTNSIIIFDWTSKHLYGWNTIAKTVTRIHKFNDEMKKSRFTTVSLGSNVYVLTERSLHQLRYCDFTARWEKIKDLDGRHGSEPPATVVSGSIYIVGSGGRSGLSKAVSKYDPSDHVWGNLKDKIIGTNYAVIAASNKFVYSIGGDAGGTDGVTDRVERLNVFTKTWYEVAPMNEKRLRASAVQLNGAMIVAGGAGSSYNRLNSVEMYNIEANQWTLMKPMGTGRSMFRLHSIGQNIFAVAGDVNERAIEKYSSSNGRWEEVSILEPDMKIYESVAVKTIT